MRGAQFENGGAFRDGRDLQVIIDTIILIAINILGQKHSEILTIFEVTIAGTIILIVFPGKNPSKMVTILRSPSPSWSSWRWRMAAHSKI